MHLQKIGTIVAPSILYALLSLAGFRSNAESSRPAHNQCDALTRVDFSIIQDAPTQIIDTKNIEADGRLPSYCEVHGYVAPRVGFRLKLPTPWNRKFIQVGCGGSCGNTDDRSYVFNCDAPLKRGYSCIVSDAGHLSSLADELWAYQNPQAQIDSGYRGAHVTTLAGKAIVEKYFGTPTKTSYFMGCSGGGRQALIEAQRFPWDYDGIVAGAPSIKKASIFFNIAWAARAYNDGSGSSIFSRADLEALHQAVLSKCDLIDGVEDGLIADPLACAFDPSELSCTKRSAKCLSPRQIEAAERIYSGPTTSKGLRIGTASALPGAELEWSLYGLWKGSNRRLKDVFAYMLFDPPPGPSWTLQHLDFDRDYKRTGVADSLYDADNPDLRAFKSAGGKLLLYSGWNDVVGGTPELTVNYYEAVERVMGGPTSTETFLRLFMLPGVGHCGGGIAPSTDDYLRHMEEWVEQDEAPDAITATAATDGSQVSSTAEKNAASADASRAIRRYISRP